MTHDGYQRHSGGKAVTRRGFFDRVVDGIYGTALATLLSQDLYGGLAPVTGAPEALPAGHRPVYNLEPRNPDFAPKSKAVIQLFMNGGPSHVDLFDPKQVLDKHDGESFFDKVFGDLQSPQAAGGLLRSPFKFSQCGKSGIWLSELMPHLADQVDNIALIRSMVTVHPNHEQALFAIHSGRTIPGRPSLGAWVVYGLGSQNRSLPAYVVLDDPLGLPINGIWNWQAGFLPPVYQGTRIRTYGSPIVDLHPDEEEPSEVARL